MLEEKISEIRLTSRQSEGNCDTPVFVDSEGVPLDYTDGFRLIRKKWGWSVTKLAELCGVSSRTVQGWEQGRKPSTSALKLLNQALGNDDTTFPAGDTRVDFIGDVLMEIERTAASPLGIILRKDEKAGNKLREKLIVDSLAKIAERLLEHLVKVNPVEGKYYLTDRGIQLLDRIRNVTDGKLSTLQEEIEKAYS